MVAIPDHIDMYHQTLISMANHKTKLQQKQSNFAFYNMGKPAVNIPLVLQYHLVNLF
jgi:hypothetical protein